MLLLTRNILRIFLVGSHFWRLECTNCLLLQNHASHVCATVAFIFGASFTTWSPPSRWLLLDTTTFEVTAGYLCGPRESPVVSPVIPLGEPLAVAYPKSIPEGPLPSPTFGSFGPHRAIITSYPALIGNRPFSFGVVVSVRGYFCILRNITFLYPSQHNLQPYFIVQR